jgi:hypothetical protein
MLCGSISILIFINATIFRWIFSGLFASLFPTAHKTKAIERSVCFYSSIHSVTNFFYFIFWHTVAKIEGMNWTSGLLNCLWEPLLLFYGRFPSFWKVISEEPRLFPSINVTVAVNNLKFELNELLPPFAYLTLTKDISNVDQIHI